MSPREPTIRIARAIVESSVFVVDPNDANAVVGAIRVLDLDASEWRLLSFCRPRCRPETWEEVDAVRRLALPKNRGRRSPEVEVEAAVEFDRSLRFLSARRRA